MGTWKLAVLPLENPNTLYFVKNSGEFLIAHLEGSNTVVVTTEQSLLKQSLKVSKVEKVPNNFLVELKDDCSYTMERLEKQIIVDRKPKGDFEHIFQEEIYEAADAVNNAIDFGQKFVSNH